jgi:hypothetical protein
LLTRSGYFTLAAAALAATTLAGCDDFNRAIGREKVVPDEFAVVSRAPLAIPPDFSLRPPRIGAQRPQETPPVDQARQTVFRAGEDQQTTLPPAADQRSPGEGELLREAGAANAPTDIRQLVDTEAQSSSEFSDSFVDKLAFWRKDKPGPSDQVIDPAQETERLKGLKDTKDTKDTGAAAGTAAGGAAPAATPTGLASAPTIERTKPASSSSWFGSLF